MRIMARQAGDCSLWRRFTMNIEGWHVVRLSGLHAVQQSNLGMLRVLRDMFSPALALAMTTRAERLTEISSGD